MAEPVPDGGASMKFVHVAQLAHLEGSRSKPVRAGTTDLLLCRVGGAVFAIENLCSHMRRPIGPGRLQGYLVTCSIHAAQFDVRDGSAQGFPAVRAIRRFDVEIREDEVWVLVPVGAENGTRKSSAGIDPDATS